MKQDLTAQSAADRLHAAPLFRSSGKGPAAPVRTCWLTLAMLLLQCAAAAAAPAAGQPVVRDLLVSKDGNGARIEIRADQPLAYRSYPMPGLEKWVVDLPGARTASANDESKKMRTPPLERITIRQQEVNGDQLTRIGLDFKGEVDFSLREDPLDKGHLVIIMKLVKPAPLNPAVVNTPPRSIQRQAPE
jgi:hypothetical protein